MADIKIVRVLTEPQFTQVRVLSEPQLTQVKVLQRGVPGQAGAAPVVGEIPQGAINGANATFQALHDFVPESVTPYLGGVRLRLLDDFVTQGFRTIQLNFSPEAGENFVIDYQKR